MTNKVLAKDIIQMLEYWAPKELAYDWDNVGLQLGTLNKEVKKVMISLDVLENVADEAIANDIDLIIAHHPLLFKATKQINVDQPKGKTIAKLLKHDITVYAAHTNLDIAFGGVNDMLTKQLDITNTDVLVPSGEEAYLKLVVYVPTEKVDEVKQVLGDNGAGHLGNYSHCTFEQKGTGSFTPQGDATPYIGTIGKEEQVNEVKLETIIPSTAKDFFVRTLLDVHPYEEPAYDLIPLANEGKTIGVGRIGTIREERTLREFCEDVKEKLDVPALRSIGDLNKKIKKVAVLGGSGQGYIAQAKRLGADVYLTGDLTFHDAQEAWEMGLAVIDPGHHVEKVMIEGLIQFFEKQELSITFVAAKSSTEPFQFL
ncbi:GTP cyclohydrolase 1 type 2 homolog [Paraliobacillus ryukyuensis]|uniref:GTP cyclohydrolase 1 type 2 homolog n=2 Tax=Paraliobacillus ryukyuensis TaxID=200904 RepID=A0A366EG49_9BACI|nr:dinuclear metal center YbgI/SA1388 family protein [Paraliobacillus ryukyuensis]